MIKKVVVIGILVVSVVWGIALPVFSANDTIIVAVDEGYPPYMFGTILEAKGLYPQLIEAIFTRIGMTVDIQAFPWKRALNMGEKGEAVVGGIYKNHARLKIYDYSEPIFEERLVVYVKKGKRFPFTQFSDLQGKLIGLNWGWSYGEEFDAARSEYHLTVVEVGTNTQNFRKLIADRIDCLIADQTAASQIIRQENLKDQVEQLDKAAAVNQAYIVFAKHLKKQEIIAKFNAALAEMKQDGSYEKLIQDFMNNAPE